MSTASINPGLSPIDPGDGPPGEVRVWPVTPELQQAAAARLIGEASGDPAAAAERFLASAGEMHIDLSLMWCTLEAVGGGVPGIPADPRIGQVCLAVIGSGRTAMIFVSGARKGKGWSAATRFGGKAQAQAAAEQKERVALIQKACEAAGAVRPGGGTPAVLAQALLETREAEIARAFRVAGFAQLGDLAYMRRPMARLPGRVLEQAGTPEWPQGMTVSSIDELARAGASERQIHDWLVTALERSYVDTKDCPELCGMRSIEDVLQSHRSVGELDPTLWWLVQSENGPQGCLLMNVSPAQDAVELVYLGLSPEARGIGMGAKLLSFGLRRLYDDAMAPEAHDGHPHVMGSGGVTCAVDTRNVPAMKLYRRAGFERFGLRLPLVRSLRGSGG